MSAPVLPSQPMDTAARHTDTPWCIAQDIHDGRIGIGSTTGVVIAALTKGNGVLKIEDARFLVDSINSNATLKARNAELEAALRKIASYSDEHGERHLKFHGSYAGFDEPASVKLARAALSSVEVGK